jgi:hypothetical protein
VKFTTDGGPTLNISLGPPLAARLRVEHPSAAQIQSRSLFGLCAHNWTTIRQVQQAYFHTIQREYIWMGQMPGWSYNGPRFWVAERITEPGYSPY